MTDTNFPQPRVPAPGDVFNRAMMGGYAVEDVDIYYREVNDRLGEMDKALTQERARADAMQRERDEAQQRYKAQLRNMDSNSTVNEARQVFLAEAREEAAGIVATAETEAGVIVAKAKEFADGERTRMEAASKKNQDDFEARLERETKEHIDRLSKLDRVREEDNENRKRKERESLDKIAAHKAAAQDEIEAASRKAEKALAEERALMEAEFEERERKFQERMDAERKQFAEYKAASRAELEGYAGQFHAKTLRAVRAVADAGNSIREVTDLGETLTTIVSNKKYANERQEVPQKADQAEDAPKSARKNAKP